MKKRIYHTPSLEETELLEVSVLCDSEDEEEDIDFSSMGSEDISFSGLSIIWE